MVIEKAVDVRIMIEKLVALYTQREIAKRIGVSNMTVTSWKKGWYRPKGERMQKLMELYDDAFKSQGSEERSFVPENEISEGGDSQSDVIAPGA